MNGSRCPSPLTKGRLRGVCRRLRKDALIGKGRRTPPVVPLGKGDGRLLVHHNDMNTITLEKFQGPLDLLLQLIEQEKLNITEIAIARVTEQYFAYLSGLGETRSDELADFLVIATRLVYLKSKELLPYLYPEEDEGPSLADQLKLYKRYADASKTLEKLWNNSALAYGRVEPPAKPVGFVLPRNALAENLRSSFLLLLQHLKPMAPLPQVSIDRSVSVRQKIESIYNVLQRLKQISFKNLLAETKNRTEVIVSFLAVLELVKAEKIAIKQTSAFEEMMLKKV